MTTPNDHDELVRLSHTYGDAVRIGAGAVKAWAATWTADAEWELPGRSVAGIDAISALWCAAMARYSRVVQMYLSATFDVEGDQATGRIQLLELNEVADGGRAMMAGHYDDTYHRSADGWRFASRRLTVYYHGAADLSNVFQNPEI